MAGVNSKVKGMRGGEIALFISGTGAGKSTLIREIVLHIIETTGDKVGIISLEESPGETGIKLAAMMIHRNPANEEIIEEDLKVGFDKVFGDDRVIVLDHQGSIKDESIITQLEYMCLMGCKYLVIDHITILVSEGAEGLTGNEAIDKIMNDLLRVVKRHNAWIGLISHLRKVQTGGKSFEEGRLPSLDDIRGSGSIKQVSFDIIAFARNSLAADEFVKNTLLMAVLKSRTIGLTGMVPGATYNHATGRLTALSEEQFEPVHTQVSEF
jgi:twinkle protein